MRLDERPADIVVADQAHLQRQTRRLGKPRRRAHARVGHRHDDVGERRLLAREPAAQLGAHFVDALAEHVRVRPREVDVLEDAVRRRRRRERMERLLALRPDDEHLARLDVANPLGVDEIERARLGADDVGVAEPAERQRPEAVRIAHGNQAILRQQHERERALRLRDRLDQRLLRRRRPSTARRDAAAPRCRWWSGKSTPARTSIVAQLLRVDEVAVVARWRFRRARSRSGSAARS